MRQASQRCFFEQQQEKTFLNYGIFLAIAVIFLGGGS